MTRGFATQNQHKYQRQAYPLRMAYLICCIDSSYCFVLQFAAACSCECLMYNV